MDRMALMVADNFSADVTRNTGSRSGRIHTYDDYATSVIGADRQLDIDVIHWLTWRDGKVVEGRGAIFGDGTAQYDEFWT